MDMASSPDLTIMQRDAAVRAGLAAGVEVRIVSAADAADPQFAREWDALAARASEPNPFFERWFLLPSLKHLGPGSQVNIKTLRIDGELLGLLPVSRVWNYYGYPLPHASVWLHANAFCGAPLVARGFERAFWGALLDHFDRHSRKAAFLHLPHLPAEGPVHAALDHVLCDTRRPAFTVETLERAMLAGDCEAETYLNASMSAKKRKELRRQRKRLEDEGSLSFERENGLDGIEQWIADFLRIEAAGWKGEAGSALANAPATQRFFTETLVEAARAGRLERLSLKLNGKAIAMLATFLAPPGAYSFKTTFNEAYARFSPGLLLQLENLDLLTRPGIEWADSCAVEGHSMIERIWREKRRLVSRNIAIGGPLRRAAFRTLMAYETRGRTQA